MANVSTRYWPSGKSTKGTDSGAGAGCRVIEYPDIRFCFLIFHYPYNGASHQFRRMDPA
jgi:hypothetical protein